MTNDELRALADVLSRQRQADEHGIYCAVSRQAVDAAIKYLRAQADAQPVAWLRPENRVEEECTARTRISIGKMCPPIGTWQPLYTRPAPAAPQTNAKPVDFVAEARNEIASWPKWMQDTARTAAATMPTTQAEPKREPLPGLAPTHRCPACGALWRQCDDASWNLRSALCCGLCDAGRVELLRLVDDPKREPLSDERITNGEYVLATKWGDGDPGDHWGVGFYDRFENGRHYVVDSAGKQIRGNGFRRVGRITADVGRWLLSAAKSLEASPPGTVNLWTMLTERAHRIGGSDAE